MGSSLLVALFDAGVLFDISSQTFTLLNIAETKNRSQKIYTTSWIIHIEHSQNFQKNYHFLPPDTYTYMCVSAGKKC